MGVARKINEANTYLNFSNLKSCFRFINKQNLIILLGKSNTTKLNLTILILNKIN